MKNLRQIMYRPIVGLKPRATNARTHSKKQIRQIADSIERFGFTNPVLVCGSGEIVAGHGRVAAAKLLNWTEVPTLELSHLSSAELRAYVIADNKLALEAGWDQEVLAAELQALLDFDFDITLTGFSIADVDLVLDGVRAARVDASIGAEDVVPPPPTSPVTQPGDIWQMGRHRLLCGDAQSSDDFTRLLGNELADIVFTDPPYNVPVHGHVCGLGKVRHREFAMAAGEMSSTEFQEFLTVTLGNTTERCRSGAIAYICMDWRHVRELLAAGEQAFTELKNLCVWNKTNGGMGTFYRSKHELVFVFKNGTAPHINNFGLGESGRYRTNVWDYPGISSIGGKRAEELAMHPTVKPAAMVADALRDCSKRGHIVLDPFAGSGTTLVAAQSCGRVARLIEYDPGYCDVVLRRYSAMTGRSATLVGSDYSFETVFEQRNAREGK